MSTLTPQRRVLATAAAEIGYSRWKDKLQGTKYARETQPVFWPKDTWLLANGISFCDLFITWVFWKVFGKDGSIAVLPAQPSYNTDYRASKGGRVSKPPKPGDVLVFDWNWATPATNHVGILEKVLPSGNYQTIEGNTSTGTAGSQSNGGLVARRTRRPDQVRYVIRPRWAKAGSSSSSAATGSAGKAWTTSPRVNKMTTADVKKIQNTLLGFDLDLGKWGADGKYGDTTGKAVQQLQTELGLEADGVYGPGTEKAIMTIKSDIDWVRRVVEENQRRITAIREELDWVRRVAEANQKRIDKVDARVGPIKRDGKDLSLRQELADAKTIATANAGGISAIQTALDEADVDATEAAVPDKIEG